MSFLAWCNNLNNTDKPVDTEPQKDIPMPTEPTVSEINLAATPETDAATVATEMTPVQAAIKLLMDAENADRQACSD